MSAAAARRLAFLLAALLAPVAARADAGLGPLLEKMASAYGGRQALGKLVSLTQTGRVEAAVRTGVSGPLTRTYTRGRKLRVQIGDPTAGGEVRELDGKRGWRSGEEVTGPAYDAMLLQAVRLDLPFELLQNQARVVDRGAMNLHGKDVRLVELPLEGGLSVTAAIDPASGHIVYSSGQTRGGPSAVTFATMYDDFRVVDGFLFAFREANFVRGQRTADTVIARVAVLRTAAPGAVAP